MRIPLLILLLVVTGFTQAESLRVSTETLKGQLGSHEIVIVDARPAAEYLAGHITGAVNFPEGLSYQEKSESGRIVQPDTMQRLLQERGIDKHSTVAVYDGGTLLDASRIFWAFEVYGLTNVKVLSPGYDDWVGKGYPTSSEIPKITPSNYVPTINHRHISSKLAAQLASVDSNQQIIDARPPEAYQGVTSTAKRYGHIPNAVNLPLALNIDKKDGVATLRDIADLQSTYAKFPKDKKIVTYCEIGRMSSVSYLVLRELGYNVSNYDGSWREWGNDFALPIAK